MAYKDPQSTTVAPLLPLLPPPAAPPWPPRSSSRRPANPALHCPLRPPQQLRYLLVKLHARGIETQTSSRRRSPFAPPPASSGSPRTGRLRRRPSTTATPEASTSSRGARARLVSLPRALLHLQRRRTEQPTRHQRRRARTRTPNTRTSTRVGVPRSLLSHASPRGSPVSPAPQNTTGKMPRRRRPEKDPVVICFFRLRVFLQVSQCIPVNS